MEDTEILLKTDPLAKYIKEINIPLEFHDSEIQNKSKETSHKRLNNDYSRNVNHHMYTVYQTNIISSELLFSDDSDLVLQYTESFSSPQRNKLKYISLLTVPISGTSALFYKSTTLRVFLGTFCIVSALWKLYTLTLKLRSNEVVSKLIDVLKEFSKLIRKCLCMIVHYITTLNYYTNNSNKLSLGRKINEFKDNYNSLLYMATSLLRQNSLDLLCYTPLSIDVKDVGIIDFVENAKLKDIKILYEYYLLVQSHFLKVLALTFSPKLWITTESDVKKVFSELKNIVSDISEKINSLTLDYNSFKGINAVKLVKMSPKRTNIAISGIHDNLYLAEIHLHQLLNKVQDSQKLLEMYNPITGSNNLYEKLEQTMKELDKQIDNPKHYLNAASIILQRTMNNTASPKELTLQDVTNGESFKNPASTIPDIEPLRSNEVYELFIPKEGLPPLEDIRSDEKFLASKDLQYSTTLLEELRHILKERNPEITDEEQHLKENDKNRKYDSSSKFEIFRPQHPVGFLSDGLQNILAARQQIQNEDKFCDDSSYE